MLTVDDEVEYGALDLDVLVVGQCLLLLPCSHGGLDLVDEVLGAQCIDDLYRQWE